MDWMSETHSAEMQERQQKRDAAIDASEKANTDDEIWDSQKGIVDNLPQP